MARIPTNPRLDDILMMRRSGLSLQAISDQVGITRERVRQLCDKYGALPPLVKCQHCGKQFFKIAGGPGGRRTCKHCHFFHKCKCGVEIKRTMRACRHCRTMQTSPFTDDTYREMVARYESGETFDVLAKELGMSTMNLWRHMVRLGVKSRKPGQYDRHKEGKDAAEKAIEP